MNYNYLVPANSKRQGLILGLFNPFDMIILGVGITISFMLFLLWPPSGLLFGILDILPGLLAAFLVFPLPNYHNVRTFLRELYNFYFIDRRKYIWRGWCYKYEQFDDK